MQDTIIPENKQGLDLIMGEIALHDQKQRSPNPFPIHVFPEFLQGYIKENAEKLNHTEDYLAGAILSAASTLIGTKMKLKVKNKWEEKCNLFMIIAGRPGDGKTHAISSSFTPIEKKEREYFDRYKNELSAYRKDQKKDSDSENLEKPKLRKRIIQDFTIEALMLVHSFNKVGLTIKMDEAMGFFKNIGRYNSSGELEQYLSLWSGQSVSVDRKTTESIRIDDTFVGLIGTIQSSILNQLTKDDKGSNGFLDRILWVYPESPRKQYWGEDDIDPEMNRNYDSLMEVLANWSDGTGDAHILTFEPRAKDYLIQWQNHNTDIQDALSDMEISINKKLEQYVLRFAIILEALEAATKGKRPDRVSESTVKGAILLYDYFKYTALKVRDVIDKVSSPLEGLSEMNRRFYLKMFKSSVKGQIRKGEAVECAMDFYREYDEGETSKETNRKRVDRMFGKKELFKKIKHGVYEFLIDPNSE